MTENLLIPAAQYLRMSTEHQQYSTQNQMSVISQYAASQGFTIVRTYSDPAKSGLWLRNRPGLRELLRDVAAGEIPYRAILVYDVSRWGRFQDTDESAHYEFLCKSAGIPIHYCAEGFPNDGSMFSLITKNLKRLMAAEYSRELGTKVLAGQKRLAELGFKQGGPPGYGLRRMLLSPDRKPKQLLAAGERKSIATDRVILAPGPRNEVECIREIFKMFVIEKRSIRGIVKELNLRGVPFLNDRPWSHCVLRKMLCNPKYVGCNVFNRQTMRLGTPRVERPRAEWIVVPRAHQGIVDSATFDKAQQILGNLTVRKTNEQILESLSSLLACRGRLTPRIIRQAPDMVGLSTLRNRFGGLRQVYQLIGYKRQHTPPTHCVVRTLRNQLLSRIQEMFPDEVSIVKEARWRSRLKLRNGLTLSVVVARMTSSQSWRVDTSERESQSVTMLARVNPQNNGFQDFHVFPKIESRRFWLQFDDERLSQGKRLTDLSQFCDVIRQVQKSRRDSYKESAV